MNFKKWILILLIASGALPAQAQYHIQGRILSVPGKQPISFANIGIINTSVGTISNEDGSFSLKIPQGYTRHKVIFSSLGYQRLDIPIEDLAVDHFYTIYLKESPTELHTVTVTGDHWKKQDYRLGNRRYEGSCLYADTVTAGSAMALKIKTENLVRKNGFDYPLFVKEAQLTIVNNTFDEFKIRTRLNEVNPVTGHPGKDILNESVITRSSIENGRLKVDLSAYNIQINGEFFLTFEWILDREDRNYLYKQYEGFRKLHPEMVSMDYVEIGNEKVPFVNYQGNLYAGPSFGISLRKKSLQDHVCFYRLNSFGKWNRSSFILAASIILSNQPPNVNPDASAEEKTFDDAPEVMLPYYKMEPKEPDTGYGGAGLLFPEKDTTYFSQRLQDPVSIELRRENNRIGFYAHNHSLYPYSLKMNFHNIFNLQPMVSEKRFIVYPGKRPGPLLTFNVIDPSIEKYRYDLSVKQAIGDSSVVPSYDFPYLLPVGNGEIINPVLSDKETVNPRSPNIFVMNGSDKAYAMRKGIVTATPNSKTGVDRISMDNSFEVRHADGTVMVYYNLDPRNIFVSPGEYVFPGQPLGKINPDKQIEVELFEIIENDRLRKLPIHYFSGEKKYVLYHELQQGQVANHPEHLVIREMTDKEVVKYKQDRLFNQ